MSLSDEQFAALISALRCISHGDVQDPMGLEGIGIALAGSGLANPVGESINRLADAVENLAEAIREIKSS